MNGPGFVATDGLSLLNPGGDGFELLVNGAAWLAAAIGCWWVASVALWALAQRSPAVTPLLRLTIPGSRRAAGALLSLAVVTGACGSGPTAPDLEVLGTAPPTTSTTIEAGRTTTTLPDPTTTAPTTPAPTTPAPKTNAPTTTAPSTTVPPETRPSTTTSETAPEPDDAPEQAPTETETAPETAQAPGTSSNTVGDAHTVAPGESLWSIARTAVLSTNPDATNAEVADYWRQLIATTRDQLTSSSPDLIYPGETIAMPPIPH